MCRFVQWLRTRYLCFSQSRKQNTMKCLVDDHSNKSKCALVQFVNNNLNASMDEWSLYLKIDFGYFFLFNWNWVSSVTQNPISSVLVLCSVERNIASLSNENIEFESLKFKSNVKKNIKKLPNRKRFRSNSSPSIWNNIQGSNMREKLKIMPFISSEKVVIFGQNSNKDVFEFFLKNVF